MSTPKRKRDDESTPAKGSRWTQEEHEELAKGLARYGKDKQKLAALIPYRTAPSVAIYITRNYTKLLEDSRVYKANFDDDDDEDEEDEDEDDDEDDDKMEEEGKDEPEKDNDEVVQQVTSTPGKQKLKWTQKEHEKLAKGLARYGRDIPKLATLMSHRSAPAVGAYISRKYDELVEDSKKYDKATEAADEDDDSEEGADDDNNQPPPKKKAKHDDTEPVGFLASLGRFLSGSWFWPSSMPTDNNNGDDNGNDDNDSGNDDDDVDGDDGKISGVSKGGDVDDLLHLLPDVALQFLNSINIKSDRELLCAQTFELGEKYELFREENDMYAYSGNGAKAAISHMKKKIRDKAKEMGNTELAELNMDQRRNMNRNTKKIFTPRKINRKAPPTTTTSSVTRNKKTSTPRKINKKAPPTTCILSSANGILQQSLLPQVGVQFLNSINIKSADVFLTTRTVDLAVQFTSFLEENDMKSITEHYAQVKMSTWKGKVRDTAKAGGYTELAKLGIRIKK